VSLGPEADDKPLVKRDGLIAIVQPNRQPCLLMSVLKTRNHEKTIYKSFATDSENAVFLQQRITAHEGLGQRTTERQLAVSGRSSTDVVPLTQRPCR
jgi:hypothetical protein